MAQAPSLPALLRRARVPYKRAVRAALAEVGCEDLPEQGAAVLGAIARSPSSAGSIAALLDISKQSASQLIDALALRGYVERVPDTVDRRRICLTPTERGLEAARAARSAVQATDAALAQRISVEGLAQLRAALMAWTEESDDAG